MTEKEAKTKWCPMVREIISPEDKKVAVNRNNSGYGWSVCCASGCMMWRWGISIRTQGAQNVEIVTGTGYCGLAGDK